MKTKTTFILTLFCVIFYSKSVTAQNDEHILKVFNDLVVAFGNAKSAPEIIILKSEHKQQTPAFYSPSPKPVIKIDSHFYALCQTFGKDSLNALAIVLSHELAHYYNDHSFCSDFAFAMSKSNIEFAKKLKNVSKNEKVSIETQADYQGLFYAAIANYQPFQIYDALLDAIYKKYQLPENSLGYPTKTERKEIAKNAQRKAENLYNTFKEAIKHKEENKYQEAIQLFEEINSYFPSRENYNNIGVIKTLQALALKPISLEEVKYPKRFLYPLEIDNQSRLNQNQTRGSESDIQSMKTFLKSAQRNFEKAISLDPNYTKAYINLACVFDLLGNPEAAIGKIKELSFENQKQIEAQKILAIAYYHADNETKAMEIWRLIE